MEHRLSLDAASILSIQAKIDHILCLTNYWKQVSITTVKRPDGQRLEDLIP